MLRFHQPSLYKKPHSDTHLDSIGPYLFDLIKCIAILRTYPFVTNVILYNILFVVKLEIPIDPDCDSIFNPRRIIFSLKLTLKNSIYSSLAPKGSQVLKSPQYPAGFSSQVI